jgi:hypothetical protein
VLWAKAVLAGGLMLLLVGFGLGVEDTATSVNGQPHSCGRPIPLSWLDPSAGPGPLSRPVKTEHGRRVQAACQDTVEQARVRSWGTLGLGGLLFVVGWTALRERDERIPVAA